MSVVDRIIDLVMPGARRCEVCGCKNNTASERTWYCVDNWPEHQCPWCESRPGVSGVSGCGECTGGKMSRDCKFCGAPAWSGCTNVRSEGFRDYGLGDRLPPHLGR